MSTTIKTPVSIAKKIKSLNPGDSFILSKVGDTKVVAERSGNGKTLTIIRETPSGFETIKRTTF